MDGEPYRTMLYEARVGEAAPVGETVAPASEVGADQMKLDELRSLIQGGTQSHMRTRGQAGVSFVDGLLFSSSWLTELHVHLLLQSKVSDGSLPMLGVTIAKKGRIVFSASASSTDSGSTLHPGGTLLRIYSMTKPITSVAALILIGMFQNHVNIICRVGEDNLKKYLR